MTSAATLEKIDVAALRVGMFVHLDLGWMSHPFPLSKFRIASDEQIATIRSLGLKQVRWNPEESLAEGTGTVPTNDVRPMATATDAPLPTTITPVAADRA